MKGNWSHTALKYTSNTKTQNSMTLGHKWKCGFVEVQDQAQLFSDIWEERDSPAPGRAGTE